jgi:biopolymer transport protein ExbD
MAFVLTRRLQPLRGLLDLVPAVTVVLLLLLFFLLSSSFVLRPGIKVEPPRSAFGVGTPLSRLVVAVTLPPPQVDATGTAIRRDPVLYFDDQIVTIDGLRQALDLLPASRSNPSLVIKADKDVPLDVIMNIVDIASAHHLTAIIATQPPAGPAAPTAAR